MSTIELLTALQAIPMPARRFMLKIFCICCPELDVSKQGFSIDRLRTSWDVNAKRKYVDIGAAIKRCEWTQFERIGNVLRAYEDEYGTTAALGIVGNYDYLMLYREVVCKLSQLQDEFDGGGLGG